MTNPNVKELLKRVASKGRFGDTEVAAVPASLQKKFNKDRGGKTINPKTGLEENFFPLLGALLSAAGMIPDIIEISKSKGAVTTRSGRNKHRPIVGKKPLTRSQKKEKNQEKMEAISKSRALIKEKRDSFYGSQNEPAQDISQEPIQSEQMYPQAGQMNNEAVQNNVPEESFSHGGDVKKLIKKMASKGRFGDTEVAAVPASLQKKFNKDRGGKTVNPKTGLQENFFPLLLSMVPTIADAMMPKGPMPKRVLTKWGPMYKNKSVKKYFETPGNKHKTLQDYENYMAPKREAKRAQQEQENMEFEEFKKFKNGMNTAPQQPQVESNSFQIPNFYPQNNGMDNGFLRGGRVKRASGGSMGLLDSNPGPTDQSQFEEPAPMIVAHFSQDELMHLDEMQGGTSIDPATGFREYSQLANVLSNPELRIMLDEVAMELKDRNLDPGLSVLADDEKTIESKYDPSPSDFEPEVLGLEAQGTDGDNELALIPLSVADYFDDIRGKTEYNPNTGLRQYKWFKEFVRVAASVAGGIGGFLVGGPGGAAVGAGLGTAAGNYATGADAGKSLRRGLGVGALTYGGAHLLGSGASLAGAGGAGSAAGSAAGAAGAGAGAGAAGGFGSMSTLLPLAGAGAFLYMGHKDAEEQRKRIEEKERQDLAIMRRRFGIESKPMLATAERTSNYTMPTPEERELGISHTYTREKPFEFEYYAKGGAVDKAYVDHTGEEHPQESKLVEGPGKGQDDHIPITLEEGDYVFDASATSMIGDGSSKAGGKILDRFSDVIDTAAPKKVGYIPENKNKVPALLSDSEFVLKNRQVTALGGGDNKKGADICRNMIKKIRKDKSRNKEGLPPKLGPLWKYVPKTTPLYNDIKKVGRHA